LLIRALVKTSEEKSRRKQYSADLRAPFKTSEEKLRSERRSPDFMLIRRICILKLGTRTERFNEEGFYRRFSRIREGAISGVASELLCMSRIRGLGKMKKDRPLGDHFSFGGAEGNRRFAPPESI
jgi:hypothetical protein